MWAAKHEEHAVRMRERNTPAYKRTINVSVEGRALIVAGVRNAATLRVTCRCGTCHVCYHREYMRRYRQRLRQQRTAVFARLIRLAELERARQIKRAYQSLIA